MSKTRVVWLHPNRRAMWLGVSSLALILGGVGMVAFITSIPWLRWCSLAVVPVVGYLLIVSLRLALSPRLAFEDGKLLVFLRVVGGPIRVPIDVVECFFLGQGPTLLPHPLQGDDVVDETSTIVVRLADAAQEWKHLEVKPAFGLWCDGYITIRGTWCEPISPKLVLRLNEQLVESQRELRSKEVASTV